MPIKSQMIEYPSNDHQTPAYLVHPGDATGHPGVIVIQEWWGLVPHIKDVAERFAAQGYVSLAPDLYYGEKADEPDEARKLAMAMDRDRAVSEIVAAARYLKSLDTVHPKKIGVVGWCMGGGLALTTAARGADEIDVAVAFYGMPLTEEDAKNVSVPVLGLYGEADRGIDLEKVRNLQDALEEANIHHEVHVYPDAPHAFFNETRESYRVEAAQDAWLKTLSWFARYLAEAE